MKNNDIVAKICSLAKQFQQVKNKSFIELLKETGFTESKKTISIEDIKNCLKKNTDLIESWFLYSMNKRTDQGWYLYKKNDGNAKYIVGYLSGDSSKKKEKKHSDAAGACAYFVYNELTEIEKNKINKI